MKEKSKICLNTVLLSPEEYDFNLIRAFKEFYRGENLILPYPCEDNDIEGGLAELKFYDAEYDGEENHIVGTAVYTVDKDYIVQSVRFEEDNRYPTAFKGIKTVYDLFRYMKKTVDNKFPYVINGGGYGDGDIENNGLKKFFMDLDLFDDDEYDPEIKILKPGEEYGDFKDCLPEEEYKNMYFVHITHYSFNGSRDGDVEVGIWNW